MFSLEFLKSSFFYVGIYCQWFMIKNSVSTKVHISGEIYGKARTDSSTLITEPGQDFQTYIKDRRLFNKQLKAVAWTSTFTCAQAMSDTNNNVFEYTLLITKLDCKTICYKTNDCSIHFTKAWRPVHTMRFISYDSFVL